MRGQRKYSRTQGYRAADGIVLSKIKARLGLDECKYGFTGAAPIRVDTLEYFGSLGMSINEAIGGPSSLWAAVAANFDRWSTPCQIWSISVQIWSTMCRN